jgi:hypothetical protein
MTRRNKVIEFPRPKNLVPSPDDPRTRVETLCRLASDTREERDAILKNLNILDTPTPIDDALLRAIAHLLACRARLSRLEKQYFERTLPTREEEALRKDFAEARRIITADFQDVLKQLAGKSPHKSARKSKPAAQLPGSRSSIL